MLALQGQVIGLEMASQAGGDEPANPSTQMDEKLVMEDLLLGTGIIDKMTKHGCKERFV